MDGSSRVEGRVVEVEWGAWGRGGDKVVDRKFFEFSVVCGVRKWSCAW